VILVLPRHARGTRATIRTSEPRVADAVSDQVAPIAGMRIPGALTARRFRCGTCRRRVFAAGAEGDVIPLRQGERAKKQNQMVVWNPFGWSPPPAKKLEK